ncbi:hypothetical protein C8R45DRAFT_942068 [Mycena sanguinolenta]|nr:hypothetical protein C8R45DRAFT_942068 [Mycena sanguinolenta]
MARIRSTCPIRFKLILTFRASAASNASHRRTFDRIRRTGIPPVEAVLCACREVEHAEILRVEQRVAAERAGDAGTRRTACPSRQREVQARPVFPRRACTIAAAAFEAETTYASPLLGANYRQFKAKTMFEGPMVTEHDRPFRSHGRKAPALFSTSRFPSYLDVDCRFELNSCPVQMVSNFYSAALVFLALTFGTMCITDRNHSIFSRSTSGAWMVRDWTHEALLFAINCG